MNVNAQTLHQPRRDRQRATPRSTAAERETLVLFNEGDRAAIVTSFSRTIWSAARRAGGRVVAEHRRGGKIEALDYEVALERLGAVLNWVAYEARKISARNKGDSGRAQRKRAFSGPVADCGAAREELPPEGNAREASR
ncbi:MAG: hypothetical protein ACREQY_01270 [Candidatus Binatia bacterium]